MSACTSNLLIVRPILLFSQLHFPRPIRFRFPNLKLDLDLDLSPKSLSCKSTCLPRRYAFRSSMTDSVVSRASPGAGAGDEGDSSVGALEQEALIDDGSKTFTSSGGLQATLNSLSKWLVAAVFGIIFIWRHDAEALWALSGSVLNVWLSTVLKTILNQERPVSTLRSDPGMPSSHAQSIFYAATFTIITMVEYFGLNGITAVSSVLIFAIASYFSWLRVSQKLHTFSQVAVGAALGFSVSIFWFWLWNAIVLKAFSSHLWVRIIVILGDAGICLGFVLYIIRYWVIDEH